MSSCSPGMSRRLAVRRSFRRARAWVLAAVRLLDHSLTPISWRNVSQAGTASWWPRTSDRVSAAVAQRTRDRLLRHEYLSVALLLTATAVAYLWPLLIGHRLGQ